jgi:hypothetical protein
MFFYVVLFGNLSGLHCHIFEVNISIDGIDWSSFLGYSLI